MMLLHTKDVARGMFRAAAEIDNDEQRKALADWARKCESAARRKAALALARVEPGIPVSPEEFDRDPFLLNCLNGTIELRTAMLREHRSEDLITHMAPVEYDPDARSDLWENFLNDCTDGNRELKDCLQKLAGCAATGDTSEEKLMLIHGPAGTGKSTFLEAVKATFGDYSKTANFDLLSARDKPGAPRNDIAALAGVRLAVIGEVEPGTRFATGVTKWVTGGDTVTARFLFKEEFDFKPSFKLWIACNDLPRLPDKDSGIWRRVLRVPFTHAIPKEKQDRTLKARLCDPKISGSAILAWVVKGCLRWQKEGLQIPKVVEQATDDYRREMDPLKNFFDECCIFDASDEHITAGLLRQSYDTWCKDNGERQPLSTREFSERLRERGCKPGRLHRGVRAWKGIALRPQG